MLRPTFAFLAIALLALSGCGGGTEGGNYYGGPPVSVLLPRPGTVRPGAALGTPLRPGPGEVLSTTAPAGRGVALLAPLTGVNAQRGQALVNAAKLALAPPGSPELTVLDTGSTPDGAASAAQQAVAAGVGMIIGPLTSGETAAAAPITTAAGIPMLAFTNDPAQARPGVWTLGLTPGQQIRRLVGMLQAEGKSRVAAVLPDNPFGHATADALTETLAESAMPPPVVRFHTGTMDSLDVIIREISDYANRRGPLDAQIRAARASHTAEGRKRAAELVRQRIPPAPIDALVLADFGDALHTIASLLPYYDLDPPGVRVFGPAQWAAPDVIGPRELRGAWYAAPDPAARADYAAAYQSAYGSPAPGLADFAYDAAGIARALSAAGQGYSMAALCQPDGFAGVNGVLALRPDGRVRRGLAMFELQRGGPNMIEPAPETLNAPGI
jgi:ABC-type branched-subunit amino acid transport system substrate-binding protein